MTGQERLLGEDWCASLFTQHICSCEHRAVEERMGQCQQQRARRLELCFILAKVVRASLCERKNFSQEITGEKFSCPNDRTGSGIITFEGGRRVETVT